VRTRGIARQHKGDPVLGLHLLGAARPPALTGSYVGTIRNAPVEEPRLVDVVDPLGTVPLELLSNIGDERLDPGSVRRTARTPKGNVVRVVPPCPPLDEIRRPLETGDPQLFRNEPGTGLQNATPYGEMFGTDSLQGLVPIPKLG